MTIEKLEELLKAGEGFTIEYKECVNALNNSVYETVCSFSNRYGGYILLGVKEVDHKAVVIGVNPNCITDMKKNFVNMLNNPQKINPSLYLNLEDIDYKGKKILWVYVPVSSQLQMCSGRIFDRNEDADQDITTSVDLVANISNRKSATYTERTVFPYATEEDLKWDLIGKARQMAVNKNKEHPWKNMSDMDLLKSAGLYERDRKTGKEGYNMACILLFGTKEAIMSCVPGYKTDAIYRVENLDRYDDRLIVENNLLESYDLLMEFVAKHTNDKFFLIDNVSMSVRSAIAREIVSNLLVHREFGSPFPAKLIIGKDQIYTENWNRAQRIGKIELQDFTPYPKNPILANFFVNIGYADSLGSGVRNLYKYTKIYSGGEPDFEEGDVFKLTVPLEKKEKSSREFAKTNKEINDTSEETNKEIKYTSKETGKEIEKTSKEMTERILEAIKIQPEISAKQLSEQLEISAAGVRYHLAKLKKAGILEHVGPTKKGHWKIIEQ